MPAHTLRVSRIVRSRTSIVLGRFSLAGWPALLRLRLALYIARRIAGTGSVGQSLEVTRRIAGARRILGTRSLCISSVVARRVYRAPSVGLLPAWRRSGQLLAVPGLGLAACRALTVLGGSLRELRVLGHH
jgi:hypothetical protein